MIELIPWFNLSIDWWNREDLLGLKFKNINTIAENLISSIFLLILIGSLANNNNKALFHSFSDDTFLKKYN